MEWREFGHFGLYWNVQKFEFWFLGLSSLKFWRLDGFRNFDHLYPCSQSHTYVDICNAQILAKSKHGFLVPILSPACPTWFSGRTGWAEDWHKKAESYGWIWLKFGIFCLCDIGNIWSIREGFMIEVYVNTEHSYKAQMHIILSDHNFYKRKNHSRRIWNEFFFAKQL